MTSTSKFLYDDKLHDIVNKYNKYFPEPKFLGGRVKVELNLSNYAAKEDLKKCNRC